MSSTQFLTVPDAAKLLGTTPKYVRKLCFYKELPFYKPRGRLLFDPKELEDYVRAGRVATSTQMEDNAVSILNAMAGRAHR